MADYRLYTLDGAGKIDFAETIVADDDLAALSKARQLKPDARKCEVWTGNRLVRTIVPDLTVGDPVLA